MSEIVFQSDYEFLLSVLPEKQREVVELRNWGYTLKEVADKIGVCSRERVRQIESLALRKLRHPSNY